jgi:hypothetical protein
MQLALKLLRSMLSLQGAKTNMPWGHRPHPLLGLSCLCYGWPALVLFHYGMTWLGFVFVLQVVSSLLSDHVNTGCNSIWHIVDKWLACSNTLHMIWYAADRVSPYVSLLAVIPLYCFYRAYRGSADKSYDQFVYWHIWWHITGGAIASWVLHQSFVIAAEGVKV